MHLYQDLVRVQQKSGLKFLDKINLPIGLKNFDPEESEVTVTVTPDDVQWETRTIISKVRVLINIIKRRWNLSTTQYYFK